MKRKTEGQGGGDPVIKTKKAKKADKQGTGTDIAKSESPKKEPKSPKKETKSPKKSGSENSGKENKKVKTLHDKKSDKKANFKSKVQKGGEKSEKKEFPKDKKGQRELKKKLKAERKKKKAGDDGDKNQVFELGVQAKQVWEKVRSQHTSKEEKEKLIPELHQLLKGKVEKVIRAHDTGQGH